MSNRQAIYRVEHNSGRIIERLRLPVSQVDWAMLPPPNIPSEPSRNAICMRFRTAWDSQHPDDKLGHIEFTEFVSINFIENAPVTTPRQVRNRRYGRPN